MANNFNLSDDKLASLLEIAGKKLGKDPQELKKQLESGQLDNVLGSLDPKAKNQVNTLLQNPKMVETMLQNDKIRNMLGGLLGGQK